MNVLDRKILWVTLLVVGLFIAVNPFSESKAKNIKLALDLFDMNETDAAKFLKESALLNPNYSARPFANSYTEFYVYLKKNLEALGVFDSVTEEKIKSGALIKIGGQTGRDIVLFINFDSASEKLLNVSMIADYSNLGKAGKIISAIVRVFNHSSTLNKIITPETAQTEIVNFYRHAYYQFPDSGVLIVEIDKIGG
jgi:hypothetical protein